MSSKQDRIGARTPTDIERKYDLGSMNANFAEVMGVATDARDIALEAKSAAEEASKPLTHEEVFNKLTENGEWQGLYEDEDGNVYINASYIKTGEILANLIKAGTIKATEGKLQINLDSGVLDAYGLNVRSKADDDIKLFSVSVDEYGNGRHGASRIAARDELDKMFFTAYRYDVTSGHSQSCLILAHTTDRLPKHYVELNADEDKANIALCGREFVRCSEGTGAEITCSTINGFSATGVKLLADAQGLFMGSGQNIVLSESINGQNKGIVLAWSAWGTQDAANEDWHYTFIPKTADGQEVNTGLMFSEEGDYCGFKKVWITDANDGTQSAIFGAAINDTYTTTRCGIQTTNNHWCLRYVYGV